MNDIHDIICYDTETNGLNLFNSQIIQFSAVTANTYLKVLNKIDIKVKMSLWQLPSVESSQITGIMPDELFSEDRMNEYDASVLIDKHLYAGYGKKRIFMTYNGINFDDTILRSMLYSNLQNPYFNTSKDAIKLDVLQMVRFAHYYRPDIIKTIPNEETGNASWRLSDVCKANNIEINAHDALEDVEGTMKLARIIKENIPEVWNRMLEIGKNGCQESLFFKCNIEKKPILLFNNYAKTAEEAVIPCSIVATNQRKEWILYPLNKEFTETHKELFFKKNTSKNPITLSSAMAHKINPNLNFKDILEKSKSIYSSIIPSDAHDYLTELNNKEYTNNTFEERIYEKFSSKEDKDVMKKFKNADWNKRLDIDFEDDRLQHFKNRILLNAHYNGKVDLSEDLEYLINQSKQSFDRIYNDDLDVTWQTIAKLEDEINKYENTGEYKIWLEKHKNYLENLKPQNMNSPSFKM